MTFAYAWPPSAAQGGVVRLCVSTVSPPVRVAVRCVSGPSSWSVELNAARDDAPPADSAAPWSWPAVCATVPPNATPGVYVAACSDGLERRDHGDGRDGRALLVVRAARPSASILYVLPLFTYHAYNVATHDPAAGADRGQGLYTGASSVTLARPGGGIGGHLWDEHNVDAYDLESPRQTFAHWDEKAIRWLRRERVAFDVATDWDVHNGGVALAPYRLILFFGHHEYWSIAMRTAVAAFVQGGGNVAFFCGNTCWFRIDYDETTRSMRRAGRWCEEPEDALTGLSYAFGGGKWIGTRPPSGFTVEMPDHWAFAGCGLAHGAVFGAQERLVGYECDGLSDDPHARGVPANLNVLGQSDLRDWPVADGSGELSACARASMIAFRRGGTVVNAGTTDWARVLERSDTVAAVTRNIIRRLGGDEVPEARDATQ